MNIKILDIKISTLQKRNCMLFILSIQGGKITRLRRSKADCSRLNYGHQKI